MTQQNNQPPIHRWTHGELSLGITLGIYFIALAANSAFNDALESNWGLLISALGVLPAFGILFIRRGKIQSQNPRTMRRSYDPLSLLYASIAAAGFVTAVNVAIVQNGLELNNPFAVLPNRLLLLTSFLFTAVPFYHGAITHLQLISVEQEWRRFIDFLVLLLESYLLLILSASTALPLAFVQWLALLFAIDVAWMIFALNDGRKEPPPSVWLWLNANMLLFLLVIGLFFHLVSDGIPFLSILTLVTAGRTLIDYATAWQSYFPSIADS